MNLKSLMEKRNAMLDEMESLLKVAETETRAMSEEELAQFDDIKKKIEDLSKTITAIEEAMKLEKSEIKDDKKLEDVTKEESEERAFSNFVRGVVEERAEVNLSKGDNGAVIPTSIANKIISRVYDIAPIYQLATRYNLKGKLQIPYYDGTTARIKMTYKDEFSELESTAGKLKSVELEGFLAGVLTKVSKSLINNSQFDIVNYVVNEMAKEIAAWIENELLNGTTGKVEGLSGVKQTVTTASATAITADELIDLQETVPDTYQQNAIWIMSRATRTAIRKLKDNDGNYLLNRDASAKWGYTLFGKDVYVSENMSDIEAGKTAVYYGDMSGLAVKVPNELTIDILHEKFATQHAIGVVGWIEIDAKVEDFQKIAKLVVKAA